MAFCLKGKSWSCGHPAVSVRISSKQTRTDMSVRDNNWSGVVYFLMTISWLAKDCLLAFSWLSHDFIMNFTWLAHDFLYTFLISFSQLFFNEFLDDFLLTFYHDFLMTFLVIRSFSWLSHDILTIFSRLSLDFIWTLSLCSP